MVVYRLPRLAWFISSRTCNVATNRSPVGKNHQFTAQSTGGFQHQHTTNGPEVPHKRSSCNNRCKRKNCQITFWTEKPITPFWAHKKYRQNVEAATERSVVVLCKNEKMLINSQNTTILSTLEPSKIDGMSKLPRTGREWNIFRHYWNLQNVEHMRGGPIGWRTTAKNFVGLTPLYFERVSSECCCAGGRHLNWNLWKCTGCRWTVLIQNNWNKLILYCLPQKSIGYLQFHVYFWILFAITVKVAWQIFCMNEGIDAPCKHWILSELDASSIHYQIEVDERKIVKAAFSPPHEGYKFPCMLFP